ncbi:MAG TPA: 3-hydroxyacyl-CoA dehydrogenase [Stellaceae bacterium]|nr:3-hydroxyacyl-CoA dehydrogenase [Stellaceae bacterium]
MSSAIAIIGSGLIGRAWTISFARAGHAVRLYDADAGAAGAAIAFIESVLDDLAANDLLAGHDPAVVRGRIVVAPSLAAALDGAVHVQENTPEDLATKRRVFAELDAAAGQDTVLASSSSALVPSSFTEGLGGRARCLVVHPINPPYLVPAVEIVPAPWTAPDVVERTRGLMTGLGQSPIVMARELDGFVMNRLQGALLEEAFRLVESGACTPEDVDIGIRDGLALRWSFMGPFETIDLNAPGGVTDYVTRYQQIYARLFPSMQRRADWAGPVLKVVEQARRGQVATGALADRQRWRDRRLMALLRHKRDAGGRIGD